jgi:psp operon transcriptional activator
VFLDEIGNATAAVQEKLLRVIEYGTFQRVGGNENVRVDVRILAGTNADLRGGGFRADLLDRLAFDVIVLPPLRARVGDVLVLARHFAQRMTAELGRDYFPGFSAGAEAVLEGYGWPGNVRELRNVVERSVYRMADPARPLERVILDPFGGAGVEAPVVRVEPVEVLPERGDFRALVDGYEKRLLEAALEGARYNQKQAAVALGLGYHQLRNALRKHGIGVG